MTDTLWLKREKICSVSKFSKIDVKCNISFPFFKTPLQLVEITCFVQFARKETKWLGRDKLRWLSERAGCDILHLDFRNDKTKC